MRFLFVLATLALILLQWFWQGWLLASPALAILVTLPLLLALPWLIRGSLRAAVVVCFVSLLHFMHGVTEAVVTAATRSLALLETALCLILYAALIAWTAKRRNTRSQ